MEYLKFKHQEWCWNAMLHNQVNECEHGCFSDLLWNGWVLPPPPSLNPAGGGHWRGWWISNPASQHVLFGEDLSECPYGNHTYSVKESPVPRTSRFFLPAFLHRKSIWGHGLLYPWNHEEILWDLSLKWSCLSYPLGRIVQGKLNLSFQHFHSILEYTISMEFPPYCFIIAWQSPLLTFVI